MPQVPGGRRGFSIPSSAGGAFSRTRHTRTNSSSLMALSPRSMAAMIPRESPAWFPRVLCETRLSSRHFRIRLPHDGVFIMCMVGAGNRPVNAQYPVPKSQPADRMPLAVGQAEN